MTKKLTLSDTDKKLAGVCGGIAEYFEVDSTVIRIVWAVSLLCGVGLLAYLICWILMPKKNSMVQY
ncbi:MAG: PspC domain-containing protein [Bacteroidales bacterium]|nr:PspC domain-containing protein [Bacteroidales bacterium]